MTIQHIDALVLRTSNLEEVVAFYRALGLSLEEERHGEGPLHFACDLGGAHIAIYASEIPGLAPERLTSGASMVGFQVHSVESAVEAAIAVGGTCLQEPDDFPWGRRELVMDPDGRTVELNCARPDS